MEDYHQNKKSSYLKNLDVNSFHEWAMSQKLLVNNFKWVEETSQFNEDFIKSYNDDSNEKIFLKVT